MRLFHRRDAPPAELVARLPRDERVVSWADAADGSVVLASPAGLWWPEPDGPRLIGWQYLDKATWREQVLTIVQARVVDDLLLVDLPPVALELSAPRDLPPTVRKRVEQNVVHTQVRPIIGGAARFVARRVPGSDGVTWWARLEPGTRDSDAVRVEVGAHIAVLAAAWAQAQADL